MAELDPRDDLNEGEEKDIINIQDSEGNEHELEIIDSVEYNGCEYLALIPVFETAEEELEDDGELVILRVSDEVDEDGTPYLETPSDDAEFSAVANLFMDRLEEMYDFEDDEDGCGCGCGHDHDEDDCDCGCGHDHD